MLEWILEHYLEIFGVVTGLIYLYMEYRENAMLWPIGLISSVIYMLVFYNAKFYADSGLQVYYIGISIYGWIVWLKGKNTQSELKIKQGSGFLLFKVITFSLLLWAGLYFVLDRFTDSPVALGDAFTSAFAISATWMLSRKIIEQWWFWAVINFVSMSLYLFKDLYLTAALYLIYSIISIAGYFEWKRKMNAEELSVKLEL